MAILPAVRRLMWKPRYRFGRLTVDMRVARSAFFLALLATPLFAAEVCNPTDLQGPYAFLLSGDTTITGDAKPLVSLGRMVLDAEGGITGYSSVMFAGFLLGNPVTGTFETRSNCTASWSLQDDSGAFQHFSGIVSPGGKRVRFEQTDIGGAQNGVLARIADACQVSGLRKQYSVTLSGSYTPMAAGDVPATVDGEALLQASGNGNFTLAGRGHWHGTSHVAIEVDSDCTVHLELSLPSEDGSTGTSINLRGILVDGAKEILAMGIDPGWMVAAKFTAH